MKKDINSLQRVVAIDFDGCLFDSDFPAAGTPNWPIINKALEERQNGSLLVLWTCREGKDLDIAIQACAECGLIFDAVNKNVQERIDFYGVDTRKIFANEYWDDNAIRINVREM